MLSRTSPTLGGDVAKVPYMLLMLSRFSGASKRSSAAKPYMVLMLSRFSSGAMCAGTLSAAKSPYMLPMLSRFGANPPIRRSTAGDVGGGEATPFALAPWLVGWGTFGEALGMAKAPYMVDKLSVASDSGLTAAAALEAVECDRATGGGRPHTTLKLLASAGVDADRAQDSGGCEEGASRLSAAAPSGCAVTLTAAEP